MKKIYLNEMGISVTEEIATLRKKLEVAEEEIVEQARLLGISGSREAALLSKIQDQALNYLALEGQTMELMEKLKILEEKNK